MEIKRCSGKSKHGQITIFVIIALIAVVSIILLFVLVDKAVTPEPAAAPDANLQKCIADSLAKAEAKIIDGNFYPNMTDNYELYQGEKAKYLCKASQFYIPCVNQEPMLVEKIRRDIYNFTKPDIDRCFSSMISAFEKNGYTVEMNQSYIPVNVSFEGPSIAIDIYKKIAVERNGEIRAFQRFSGKIQSPVLELAKAATAIANFESALCEFNPTGWMAAYPNIMIKRFVTGDGAKIYTLTDENSEKSVVFAVKSCVLPAGI